MRQRPTRRIVPVKHDTEMRGMFSEEPPAINSHSTVTAALRTAGLSISSATWLASLDATVHKVVHSAMRLRRRLAQHDGRLDIHTDRIDNHATRLDNIRSDLMALTTRFAPLRRRVEDLELSGTTQGARLDAAETQVADLTTAVGSLATSVDVLITTTTDAFIEVNGRLDTLESA